MEKLALVIDRYGDPFSGGAGDHCRKLAEHLAVLYEVYVLCAGIETVMEEKNGINICRFKEYVPEKTGDRSYEVVGPYCPDFEAYILNEHDGFKAIVFMNFSHWLTYTGLKYGFPNSLFIPLVHDNNWAFDKYYRQNFYNARGLLFNSVEERTLVTENITLGDKPFATTCFGIDPSEYKIEENTDKDELDVSFILYLGRVSQGKTFQELNEFFIQYKKSEDSNLKLIVLGNIEEEMVLYYHPDIVFKGYVEEKEKIKYLRKAQCLVLPSLNESLSIAVLESFICKRPILVNGRCNVLKGQCERSNGGLYYKNYNEFRNALNYILHNHSTADQMGIHGYHYVLSEYSWNNVRDNLLYLIERVEGIENTHQDHKVELYEADRHSFDIRLIYSEVILDRDRRVSPSNKYLDDFSSVLQKAKSVVIVGAGRKGQYFFREMQRRNVETIVGFADNAFHEEDKLVCELPVYSIEEAVRQFPHACFVITPFRHEMELIRQLNSASVSIDRIQLFT